MCKALILAVASGALTCLAVDRRGHAMFRVVENFAVTRHSSLYN